MSDFAARLRELIRKYGTAERFAEAINVTPCAVHHYLNRKRKPSYEILKRIHYATGCSLDWLMCGEGRSPNE